MGDRICSIPGCPKKVKGRGLCTTHYERWRVHGSPLVVLKSGRDPRPLAERFAETGWTVTPSGCWEWNGARVRGKGRMPYGKAFDHGRHVHAHRFAWELHNGPIPDGLVVRHKCDNPPCVNPEHLELGTHQDNSDDMWSRGRAFAQSRTHCKHGHDLTLPDATHLITYRGTTFRRCMECAREADRRRSRRRKAA